MRKILVLLGLAIALCGCSTTTTTTYYKDDGKTVDRVVVESEISDVNALASYLQQGDEGNATDRALDVTKFSLGYADIGLSWLSIGGNSTKAPATSASSNLVLGEMAKVKKANKTTIQTDSVGVNAEVAKTDKDSANDK